MYLFKVYWSGIDVLQCHFLRVRCDPYILCPAAAQQQDIKLLFRTLLKGLGNSEIMLHFQQIWAQVKFNLMIEYITEFSYSNPSINSGSASLLLIEPISGIVQ